MTAGTKRFIELVIATTIGSIVGAYIARDIQFSLNLFIRALFATCLLAIFFFFIWQFSTHIGKRRKLEQRHYAERYEETPESGTEAFEEPEPEPYEEYADEGEEGLAEDFEEPEEKQQL
jgi:uncharacterized protein YacL